MTVWLLLLPGSGAVDAARRNDSFKRVVPPFARRFTEGLSKTAIEVTLIRKSGLRRDFGYGEIRLAKEAQCLGNADAGDVGDESHSRHLFEDFHELSLAHVNQLRGLLDGYPFCIVQTQIFEKARQPIRLLPMLNKLGPQHLSRLEAQDLKLFLVREVWKEGIAPHLPTLENNVASVNRAFERMDSAERRARRERGNELQRFDSKRPRHVRCRISSTHDRAPRAGLKQSQL